jgi:hypothetical protein
MALRGWPGLSCTKAGHDGKRSRTQPQNANQQLRCFLLQKPEYCVIAVGSGRTDLRLNCKALDGGAKLFETHDLQLMREPRKAEEFFYSNRP